jgi:hypothetical protein
MRYIIAILFACSLWGQTLPGTGQLAPVASPAFTGNVINTTICPIPGTAACGLTAGGAVWDLAGINNSPAPGIAGGLGVSLFSSGGNGNFLLSGDTFWAKSAYNYYFDIDNKNAHTANFFHLTAKGNRVSMGTWYENGAVGFGLENPNVANAFTLASNYPLTWDAATTGYIGTGVDTAIYRVGANMLSLGGTTSAFPAIKRNGAAINFRLADNSADATITAATQAQGNNSTNVATTAYVDTGLTTKEAAPALVTLPTSDVVCAKGSDTTIAALTITGATNAAPIVFTVSTSPQTQGYVVGQTFAVTGANPSAYNGTYHVTALSASTITADNGGAPGSAWTSGGTVYMPCNNSIDAADTWTNFATVYSVPGGAFGTNTAFFPSVQLEYWTPATAPSVYLGLYYGSAGIYSSSAGPLAAGAAHFMASAAWSVFSPGTGVLYATLDKQTLTATGNTLNNTGPVYTSTGGAHNLNAAVEFTSTGLASGTYTSGGSVTGTVGQTCNLGTFNNGLTSGTATVALTGTNTIAGGTAIVVTNTGYAATSAPTSATFTSGTATCSGSPTLSTTLGGAQGTAIRLLTYRVGQ